MANIKARILEYYKARTGQFIYPSDVAIVLNLDAYLVFQITNELVEEGQLE